MHRYITSCSKIYYGTTAKSKKELKKDRETKMASSFTRFKEKLFKMRLINKVFEFSF